MALVISITGCSFYPQNKSVGVPFCAAGEGEVYELVVRRNGGSPSERIDLRTALGNKPGFRCALPLTGIDDPSVQADLVVWANAAAAKRGSPDGTLTIGVPLVRGLFADTVGAPTPKAEGASR
jgi:hypothetical protein